MVLQGSANTSASCRCLASCTDYLAGDIACGPLAVATSSATYTPGNGTGVAGELCLQYTALQSSWTAVCEASLEGGICFGIKVFFTSGCFLPRASNTWDCIAPLQTLTVLPTLALWIKPV